MYTNILVSFQRSSNSRTYMQSKKKIIFFSKKKISSCFASCDRCNRDYGKSGQREWARDNVRVRACNNISDWNFFSSALGTSCAWIFCRNNAYSSYEFIESKWIHKRARAHDTHFRIFSMVHVSRDSSLIFFSLLSTTKEKMCKLLVRKAFFAFALAT